MLSITFYQPEVLIIDKAAFYLESLDIFVKHRKNKHFLRRRFPGAVVCWKSPKVGQHERRNVLLRNTTVTFPLQVATGSLLFIYLSTNKLASLDSLQRPPRLRVSPWCAFIQLQINFYQIQKLTCSISLSS